MLSHVCLCWSRGRLWKNKLSHFSLCTLSMFTLLSHPCAYLRVLAAAPPPLLERLKVSKSSALSGVALLAVGLTVLTALVARTSPDVALRFWSLVGRCSCCNWNPNLTVRLAQTLCCKQMCLCPATCRPNSNLTVRLVSWLGFHACVSERGTPASCV